MKFNFVEKENAEKWIKEKLVGEISMKVLDQ